MTTTTTTTSNAAELTREFRRHLPAAFRHRLYSTKRVEFLVDRAVNIHGWTVEQLAAEAGRDLIGTTNAGGVVTFRLEHLSEGPPPDHHTPRVTPFCSDDCRERRGFLEDNKGNITGRCPCRSAT